MGYQSTYATDLTDAVLGQIANTEPNVVISRVVESAAIGYGKAVKQGTNDQGVVAATAAADVFRGITIRDQSTLAGDDFDVGETAALITQGVVWVTAGATVAAGAAVYMVVGTAHAGKFTSVATNNLPIPDAIFDSSGAVNELVKIRLR